ncbi:hypothetical protein JW824_09925 [bacterium]|nr:hypothetical protein [bacterium]
MRLARTDVLAEIVYDGTNVLNDLEINKKYSATFFKESCQRTRLFACFVKGV